MSNSYATSGNSGPKVRSDCEMILELRDEGGIVMILSQRFRSFMESPSKNNVLKS